MFRKGGCIVRGFPLFWKLYLGVLAVVFFPVVVFEMSSLLYRPAERVGIPPHIERHMEWVALSVARTAAHLLRSGDRAALSVYLDEAEEANSADFHLPEEEGFFPPLPEQVRTLLAEAPASGVQRLDRGSFFVTVPFGDWASNGGKQHLVAVFHPFGKPPRFPGPSRMLLLSMAAGALLCFVFVRHITVPIRELERTTHRLAEGDFAARAPEIVLEGGGEIARLGSAFNGMAEHIDALLTSQRRLLGDISHELRSPLQRLDVALTLARNGAAPEVNLFLDRVELEAARMNDMIGHLLALFRAEEMNGDEPNAPVDLSLLVERVAGDASFEAENEGKRVLVGELPVDLVISGDEALLASALENVVRNALRHTAPGTAVEVDLKETGSRIVLSVRDHGPGVEEQELQRIFQPFYRSDAARDRRSGGVGLGLAIAKRAVERHGGSIRASLASGGGLLVEIVLPREARRDAERRA